MQNADTAFSLVNHTRHALPRVSFCDIKNNILGKRYALSLALIGEKRIHTLNRTYRGKDAPTDILSFPLSKEAGEIVLCPTRAKHYAKKFNMSERDFFAFLFIHGCLHLKGLTHGKKMESAENSALRAFNIPLPTRP